MISSHTEESDCGGGGGCGGSGTNKQTTSRDDAQMRLAGKMLIIV